MTQEQEMFLRAHMKHLRNNLEDKREWASRYMVEADELERQLKILEQLLGEEKAIA